MESGSLVDIIILAGSVHRPSSPPLNASRNWIINGPGGGIEPLRPEELRLKEVLSGFLLEMNFTSL